MCSYALEDKCFEVSLKFHRNTTSKGVFYSKTGSTALIKTKTIASFFPGNLKKFHRTGFLKNTCWQLPLSIFAENVFEKNDKTR